jgi:hypothetical protein
VQPGDILPFAISAIGVTLDASTTIIGLSRGYYEIHSNYSPLWALLIFWSVIAVTMLLPKTRLVRYFTLIISSAPFIAVISNSLVLAGVSPGLFVEMLGLYGYSCYH